MATFKHTPAKNPENKDVLVTVASGPVIIEAGRVLLDKHGDDNFWKFPGGALRDNVSPRDQALLEARQELGLELELEGEPFIIALNREYRGQLEYVILIHYRAKRLNEEIKPGPDIKEWAWHELDNLPTDCAPNIKPAIDHFLSP